MTSEHLLDRFFISIDLWELYILILYNQYFLGLEAMLFFKVFILLAQVRE